MFILPIRILVTKMYLRKILKSGGTLRENFSKFDEKMFSHISPKQLIRFDPVRGQSERTLTDLQIS